MTHKIPCEVIQDLLPLYVDDLVSDTTREEIKEHLNDCLPCTEQYEHMKKSLSTEALESQEHAEKEIDYLKILKKKNLKKRLLWCGAVALFLCSLAFIKVFFIGSPTESYAITYLDLKGDFHIGGAYYGSAGAYSHYKIKKTENGSQLILYACLYSPWNRNIAFNLTIPRDAIKGQLDLKGNTIKEDGTIITRLTNEVYAKKNPYVGNASADGELAKALGIAENLGSYKMELQTTKEPYGWTFHFANSVPNSIVFEEKMRNYAVALIALVENLGEVTWEYTIELPDEAISRTSTITEEEATEFLRTDSIKKYAASPESLQGLLQFLGISCLPDN